MPGLLDDDFLRGLLGGSAPAAGAPPRAGLLSPFQPQPNEGLLTRVFGDSRNPADPRGNAMNALAVGLMRGDFASGLEGANRAFADAEDRNIKRAANTLTMGKSALEVAGLQQAYQRNQAIQRERERLRTGGGQQQLQATGVDGFSTPTVGDVPMFSLGTQPQAHAAGTQGYSAGAAPAANGAFGAAGGRDQVYRQLLQEADVYNRYGDTKTALEYYQRAEQFKPGKFSTTPQLMKDASGKLVQVVMNEDGGYQVLPFGAKPDWAIEDLGGTKRAIDKNELPAGGTSFVKTMTPADRISAGNLEVSRRRLQLDENTPQYMQTADGIVALPKRPAPGMPLVGQPVAGPNGETLGPPLKAIPPSANTAIIANQQALGQLDRALTLLGGQNVGDPSQGGQRGDKSATGLKGYLPNALLNRVDPQGVDTRAEISDIGSLKIHDRSGAAVTVSESPRLMPFIPLATDDAATVQKKLSRLRTEVANEAQALNETYSREQGYKPSPIAQRNASNAAKAPNASAGAMNALPPANPSNKGRKIRDNETGKVLQSDGFQWKEVR